MGSLGGGIAGSGVKGVRAVAIRGGKGLEGGARKKQDAKESFPRWNHSTRDQQRHTSFCEFKGARRSLKLATIVNIGFVVEAAFELIGGGAPSFFDA